MGVYLKKHRVSTTISQKHWELLKKHANKFETHQRVLELALESLERLESMKNNSESSSATLTVEEQIWLLAKSSNSACLIPKEVFVMLINNANIDQFKEYLIRSNSNTYAIEYYLQKPINKCSLKEVIDALVIINRTSNNFDTVDCKEDSNHYTLIYTHSNGIKGSKMASMTNEIIFQSYGAEVESIVSEKTIFMKIFKIDEMTYAIN
jgi:hypothetical protein